MKHVLSGLDVLLDKSTGWLERLEGKRVGLLVNPTSVDSTLEHAIEALMARGVQVVQLFGPEHGVRAEAQDMEAVEQSIDPISQLPVVSLYGHTLESLQPTHKDLSGLDVVIADIQDIGTRYYTYAYTIGLMMQACGQVGVPCWVLDRPNPLGGKVIEGNIVLPDMSSFVGLQPLATRHAMTIGELATFFNTFTDWTCELEVIEMKGWTRDMWFDQTGLPWVMPSPNMPTLDTAIVYPGQCLLEGTNMSEARGTTRPFELFGAPYLDAQAFAKALNDYNLPGVQFRSVSFKPMFQKHGGEICKGVQAHVTNRDVFRSLQMSLAVLAVGLKNRDMGFDWRAQAYEFVNDRLAIDLLLGDKAVRIALEDGADPIALFDEMSNTRVDFEAKREQCLMYGG